jgi:hypothetical protein
MIKWIDVVSPPLRALHQEWIRLRGAQLMPKVTEYNDFAELEPARAASALSTFVLFPADGSGPVFRHVGAQVPEPLGRCAAGTRLSALTSPLERASVLPFQRVCTSRQPHAQRGQAGPGAWAKDHEMLLLPFSDGRLRVCLVHAVFDTGGSGGKGLSG